MRTATLFVFYLLFFSCTFGKVKEQKQDSIYKFEQKDKEILEDIFEKFSNSKDLSTSELLVKIGIYFKETPYKAYTLECENETLIVNLRELDCTTFAENCLAIARTLKNHTPTQELFVNELTELRYLNGEINGYPSRIHYFSDWIYENDKTRKIKKVSKEIAETPYPLETGFMSSHPQSYEKLNKDSSLVPIIAKREQIINSRKMYFIPKNKITGVENKLKSGDIVGITTSIKGLDISHVGILVRLKNRFHLIHASSDLEKVVVSEEPLEDYLLNSRSATGIMVARPL